MSNTYLSNTYVETYILLGTYHLISEGLGFFLATSSFFSLCELKKLLFHDISETNFVNLIDDILFSSSKETN